MKSLTTSKFWRAYASLPPEIKREAKKAFLLWKNNSQHPSLYFKKVKANLWSVRVTGDYRALALKKGSDYYWI
ncbi:MAG: hypothetical protein AAF810_06630 [Cyanobacteria bacterium P01_D01_bin.36]